jgi:uncharacterized membrane protein (UPF0127 family)
MQNKETVKTVSVHNKPNKLRYQKSPLYFILLCLSIAVILFCCFLVLKDRVNTVKYKDVQIGNRVYILEVADTEGAREKGLSERDYLADNKGMLFDFKTDSDWRIWMLKMRFNIDIAWLNKDGKVIFIKHNATPGSYPEAYHAGQPSRYVIELPAGTLKNQNVNIGDKLKL